MKGGDTLYSINHDHTQIIQMSSEDEKVIINDVCVHHGFKLPLPASYINHIRGMANTVSDIPECRVYSSFIL